MVSSLKLDEVFKRLQTETVKHEFIFMKPYYYLWIDICTVCSWDEIVNVQ